MTRELLNRFTLILFGIVGTYVIWREWRNHALARASKKWLVAPGQIAGTGSKPTGNNIYAPRAYYWYTVGGIRYTGSRVAFGDDWRWGITKAERYRIGEAVEVYYNPQKPRQSVLMPRLYPNYPALVAGVVFACLGVATLLL